MKRISIKLGKEIVEVNLPDNTRPVPGCYFGFKA